MMPPRASISRTRCPLPMPPIAGLQLICPSVSMLWVSSSVRAPRRAAARAASVPAWPPPMTITSKVCANRMEFKSLQGLIIGAYCMRPAPIYRRVLSRIPVISVVAAMAVLMPFQLSAAAPATALKLTPCRLTHPSQLVSVEAQCGRFAVPEDPQAPAGRHIELFVARIPAINARGHPDPLFLLAGGPGLAATTFYTGVAPVFERIHRDRDIVLVDQRGTGGSNALNCPQDSDPDAPDSPAVLTEAARGCLAMLATHAMVADYTTSIAVRDLEAVRAALGYQTINLYGGSYGTRVAQHYLRRYPEHVRAVILDGVVPPQMTLGASLALDAQSALQRLFARCAAAAPCRARFGAPDHTFDALLSRLKIQAVPIEV